MDGVVKILGPDGKALPPTRTVRPMALGGGFRNTPYDAADNYGQNMAAWQPYLWSADGELNMFRDRIVARVRDIVRNDGWASGAVTRILDNAIGANLRPVSKPDWRWLALESGNKAFDHTWSREFGAAVDGHWNAWANDPARWCDVTRNQTFSQMAHTSFRHGLVDGDALAAIPWLSDGEVVPGKARYHTAVQLIDPDRLSNPQLRFDQQALRGGVEINQRGAAIAYHIRKAHQGDWFSAAQSVSWERVPRETSFGRPKIVHYFEHQRAGQHRGGAGIFTPVLQRLKMLVKYDSVELDSAIINAIFAAYVESPMDPQIVKEAMGGDGGIDNDMLNNYQLNRGAFHRENAVLLGGARIPQMYPGEAIKTVSASRPAANFSPFENAMLRNVASGLGLSAQQVSNDWSDVNYSSARSAALEAQKTMNRRQFDFFTGFASPIRGALLEEMMDVDDLPMPNGMKKLSYLQYAAWRTAFTQCIWIGPPRGWVNPIDERAGEILGMDAGMGTLEQACFTQGVDLEENLHQRAYEIAMFDKLGLPRPDWAGVFTARQMVKQEQQSAQRPPDQKPADDKPKKPVNG
jgi:lambda family phage portal protein